MAVWFSVIGWIGAACITLAFFLLSHDRLSHKRAAYYVLNIVGSVGVGLNAYVNHTWPSVGLQLVWVGIAVAALIRHRGTA